MTDLSKLYFYLLFLSVSLAWGKDVFLITYDSIRGRPEIVQVILEQQYGIPKELIKIQRKLDPCQDQREAFVHLCIEEKQLSVVYANAQFIKNSLKVFKNENF